MTGESILVVEDNSFIALQLKELLEKNGYQVPGTVAYGEDAVELAVINPPDLVFMDIELMGKVDGIEAARMIHEHYDVPIIYLTAFSDAQRVARAKETVPYNFLVKPYNDKELLTSVDMTLYRHKMEKQLRESTERYRAIVESAAEIILLVACRTGTIIEANPASTRLLGYTPAEFSGKSIGEIVMAWDTMSGEWEDRICSHGGWSGEMQMRCRNGSLRDVELSSRVLCHDRMPVLTSIVAHDVTDRKRGEAALRKANRKLNLLSGITRHDILNQLTALSGYLRLSRPMVTDSRLAGYIEKEIKAADTIQRMISFTREYEEIGQQEPKWQQIDTAALAKTAGEAGIVLESRVQNLEIFADPLLARVFHNLMDNAVRHGINVTRIMVSSEPADQGLLIRWEDNGAGIADSEKERIFERGYGKNTGLGLFLAREILGLTGITISESGEAGKGARFDIFVPKDAYRVAE